MGENEEFVIHLPLYYKQRNIFNVLRRFDTFQVNRDYIEVNNKSDYIYFNSLYECISCIPPSFCAEKDLSSNLISPE